MLVDVLLQNLQSGGDRYIVRDGRLIWLFHHDTSPFRIFVFLYFGTILGLLYYSFAIQARESGIGGAGEGLFAKKALKQVL